MISERPVTEEHWGVYLTRIYIKLRIGLLNYRLIKTVEVMEIGQKVKVCRLRDRVISDVAGKLGKVGVIKNFKMTDGSGVGAVVQFDDKTATWFFEDELKLI